MVHVVKDGGTARARYSRMAASLLASISQLARPMAHLSRAFVMILRRGLVCRMPHRLQVLRKQELHSGRPAQLHLDEGEEIDRVERLPVPPAM